jgi:hypothetical protein
MQPFSGQCLEALTCPRKLVLSIVHAGLDRDQARMLRIPYQAHGLSRYREAHLNLGTYGHPLHIPPQFIDQEGVSLVSPIIANGFPKQARADTEADDGLL